MSLLTVPRHITIDDAAAFAGTTAQRIRELHEIGLLPEPGRGGGRRYGYEHVLRLLWIGRMTDAGIAAEDIRRAFAGTAATDRDTAVAPGRMGLLSDFVTARLEGLPEGSLRQADLDNLLIIEHIFGPLGAAVNAGRYIAVATHPGLREESDRVDAAEEALDDTVSVDDPRVAQVAAERHAFEQALHAVIEDSGLAQADDALFDAWDALHPETADDGEDSGEGPDAMSTFEAAETMPYDFSPARVRSMELAEQLAAPEAPAS
jgi:DNA-binding transcriptional MerR regulator